MEKPNFEELYERVLKNKRPPEEIDAYFEQEREDALAKSLEGQGIPRRIIQTLNAPLKSTRAVRQVRKIFLAPKEAWVLVLSGDKGCGKSVAAGLYLKLRAERALDNQEQPPESSVWYSAVRMARMSSYNGDFDKMLRTHLMVIDDLGVEYLDNKGYFEQRFDELMNDRYENFGRTIITTNLNAQDFKERYSDRVTSRMREGFRVGGGFIEIPEESLR